MKIIPLVSMLSFIILLASLAGCTSTPGVEKSAGNTEDGAIVLEEGSVSRNGEVVYHDYRDTLSPNEEPRANVLPPLFPGAQRIHPVGEDSEFRQSYITSAPLEAVESYYHEYLRYGKLRSEDEPDGDNFVNVITNKDPNGQRQIALFVNYPVADSEAYPGDGRAGMKVLIKDYPAQHTVQIVLTTLDVTPLGLNPVGTWITPEEAEKMSADYKKEQEEAEKKRREAEGSAVDPEADSDSGSGGEGD